MPACVNSAEVFIYSSCVCRRCRAGRTGGALAKEEPRGAQISKSTLMAQRAHVYQAFSISSSLSAHRRNVGTVPRKQKERESSRNEIKTSEQGGARSTPAQEKRKRSLGKL